MTGNGRKWLENDRKWPGMTGDDQGWLEMAGDDRGWLEMAGMVGDGRR